MPPSSKFPWQQTTLKSLAQCLSEFGFEKPQDADADLTLLSFFVEVANDIVGP
jgi:hypothetical protein